MGKYAKYFILSKAARLKSCTIWQHGIMCTFGCALLLQVYYWIENSDSYCFLKQSPTGKKSQHLSWYSFQTYVSWPVNSVSSLLIKCIRKNLNFKSWNVSKNTLFHDESIWFSILILILQIFKNQYWYWYCSGNILPKIEALILVKYGS